MNCLISKKGSLGTAQHIGTSTGRAGVRKLIYSSAVKAFLLVLWYLEVLLLRPRRKENIQEVAVINRLQFLCSRFEFCVIF